MPHLQFEVNQKMSDTQKVTLGNQVRELFSSVMDTGMDHIAISIREYDTYNLSIGRAKDALEEGVALINADIREGRVIEKRRALALGFMQILHELLNIPHKHIYVTFTQHTGEDFHLSEKYLASWQSGEDPLT